MSMTNILRGVGAVQQQLKALEKDRTDNKGYYDYLSSGARVRQVRDMLAQHGIVPMVVEYTAEPIIAGDKLVAIKVRLGTALAHPESGEEVFGCYELIAVQTFGRNGMTRDYDKAVLAAHTTAEGRWLSQGLCIPAANADEVDDDQSDARPVGPPPERPAAKIPPPTPSTHPPKSPARPSKKPEAKPAPKKERKVEPDAKVEDDNGGTPLDFFETTASKMMCTVNELVMWASRSIEPGKDSMLICSTWDELEDAGQDAVLAAARQLEKDLALAESKKVGPVPMFMTVITPWINDQIHI